MLFGDNSHILPLLLRLSSHLLVQANIYFVILILPSADTVGGSARGGSCVVGELIAHKQVRDAIPVPERITSSLLYLLSQSYCLCVLPLLPTICSCVSFFFSCNSDLFAGGELFNTSSQLIYAVGLHRRSVGLSGLLMNGFWRLGGMTTSCMCGLLTYELGAGEEMGVRDIRISR